MATYKEQKKLLQSLQKERVFLISKVVKERKENYICLKRDVECKAKKAYKLCKMESELGLRATYYIQHSLLKSKKEIKYLKAMQALGADICYHHDVMDANGGDIEKAKIEFQKNLIEFSSNGFNVDTVCQHGNPVINRVGYRSNRDFLRDENVKNSYPDLVDVVVNMSQKTGAYTYISDHGRSWKVVLEPEKDESEYIKLDKSSVYAVANQNDRVIISLHPHRLNANKFTEFLSIAKFNFIRATAKILMKVPFLKKIMSRYYYLARKV